VGSIRGVGPVKGSCHVGDWRAFGGVMVGVPRLCVPSLAVAGLCVAVSRLMADPMAAGCHCVARCSPHRGRLALQ